MIAEAILDNVISPHNELLAYEYLYAQSGATLKSVTKSTVLSNKLPSQVLKEREGMFESDGLKETEQYLKNKLGTFSIAINNTPSYPQKLKASKRPTPLIYYRGDIGILDSKSVSIVGARKASTDGLRRATKLAKELTEFDYTIVSGLASGIDTVALKAALKFDGNVIGVIGTPIDEYYPKENRDLQNEISKKTSLNQSGSSL